MKALKDAWPRGLDSLRFTVHLRASELDWKGLASKVSELDDFRVSKRSIRATIGVGPEDGEYHGHLSVFEAESDGYTIVWTVTTEAVRNIGKGAPSLRSIPQFLRPFVNAELKELSGILVALFDYRVGDVKLHLNLPFRNAEAPDGPLLAGLDFEFPESSSVIRRAYIGHFTDRQRVQLSLMLRIAVDPVDDLLERMLSSAEIFSKAFVQYPPPGAAALPEV
jgi:hypothetical protein